MIARRALLAGLAAPAAARAEAPFPDTLPAGGTGLVRNGTGARRYLGVEVYRAALYLPQPMREAEAVLAAAGPKLILLRYLRAVPAQAATAAWREAYAANCACPAPGALLGWVRATDPGDAEHYEFGPEGAVLSGPGRPDVSLPGAAAARDLLATWIGPAPPTEALKRGLLGAA